MDLTKPKATAQGHRIRFDRPSGLQRWAAWGFDGILLLPFMVWTFNSILRQWDATFSGAFGIFFSAIIFRVLILQVLKNTPGTRLFYYPSRGLIPRAVAMAAILGSLMLSRHWVRENPSLSVSPAEMIQRFEPDAQSAKDYSLLPFYYSVGAWPKKFENQRYFYTLPYESGPPTHFLGRLVLALGLPDLKLTIEGPKTPEKRPASEWKECFAQGIAGFSCRAFFLRRHWNDISKSGTPDRWKIRWFEVQGDLLENERPQGVWIQAQTGDKITDRFVLITSVGIQQSLILQRLDTVLGQSALQWTQKIIGSMRTFSDILAVRAWSEKLVSKVNLRGLTLSPNDPAWIDQVLDSQATLLSQISVRPAAFDAFFHLGGTSSVMIRYFADARNTLQNQSFRGTPPLVVLREVLENSYRYCQAIAPTDARVQELSTLLAEARRF